METSEAGRALFSLFGILVLGLVLLAVRQSPAHTWVAILLGVPATSLLLIQAVTGEDGLLPYSSALEAVLYFYAAGALIAYMLEDHVITRDELFAVGATFTLVAWASPTPSPWSRRSSPAASRPRSIRQATASWMEMLFLSFTTLTSIGLSDVVPGEAVRAQRCHGRAGRRALLRRGPRLASRRAHGFRPGAALRRARPASRGFSHVPTPPSTTWIGSSRRAAEQARATAVRWPEAQMTATGRVPSSPSGSSWMSWYGRVDRAGDVACVPLGVLAHVEDLHAVRALVQLLDVEALDRATGSRSSRQLVMPPARKPPRLRDADRRGQPAAWRASSSSRPIEDDLLLAVGDPGELRAEPGPQRGDADRAGDVRVVELELGADVDEQRAVAARLLDLARRQRVHVDASTSERPAVERRRSPRSSAAAGRSPATAFSTNASSSSISSIGLCARSKPIVEETFMSIPGPPHSEPPRCPGQTSHVVGQRQQLARAASGRCRARPPLVDREVGPRDVADEQRVARQDRPRLVAAPGVDERERRVLGAVAGRVQRADAHAAELELPAVVERLVLVVGRGVAVDVDGRAGGRREPPVAGHVVGVVVRLEDVLDPHADVAREAQVLVDLELRIDDRRDAAVLVPDEVRRAAEVVVGDLAEDHASRPRPGTNLPTRAA